MNAVNGGGNAFVLCMFCMCPTDRTIRPVDKITEMPNGMDSKFGSNVFRDSPDMKPLAFFAKRGRG